MASATADKSVPSASNEGLIKVASFLARYGLLFFLCWQLSQITWWVLGFVNVSDRLVLPEMISEGQTEVAASPLSAIGLFGKPSAESVQQKSQVIDAPETRLKLELKGVVTAKKNENSGAIVAEKGRQGLYYRVGEKMPGQAELVEVYHDRVLLRRSGRMETLRFSEFVTSSGKSKGGISQVASSRGRGKKNINSPEEFLGEAQRRLGKDPVAALGSVGLRPVSSGDAQGYVYNGRNPMLRQMNLKKGDIIRSVNGYPMGNVQKDRALLKEFYDQGSVMVEIERDGTFFSINYPLR